MRRRLYPTNQKGFTLIELLSVLIIMSVMVSIIIQKFDLLSDTAGINALRTAVRELNTRETLVWTDMKLSARDWTSDEDVWNTVDKDLGSDYSWNPIPDINGGTLHFRSQSADLQRTASTRNSVGYWE